MDFKEQMLSTFIGAIAGFIFSICLFYLTELWKSSSEKKGLIKNLNKEFEYNISFLEGYKNDYEKLLRQIAADTKNIIAVFRFSKLQRMFLLEAFNKGLLYKQLTTDEISDIDAMLTYFNITYDNLAYRDLTMLNNGEFVSKDKALERFEYDRTQIEKYLKIINNLKVKFK
jgi:hypothetical protein